MSPRRKVVSTVFSLFLNASHEPLFVRSTGFSLPRHRPKFARPTDRINPGQRTPAPRFKGIMHGRMAVAASHEPPRSADLQSAGKTRGSWALCTDQSPWKLFPSGTSRLRQNALGQDQDPHTSQRCSVSSATGFASDWSADILVRSAPAPNSEADQPRMSAPREILDTPTPPCHSFRSCAKVGPRCFSTPVRLYGPTCRSRCRSAICRQRAVSRCSSVPVLHWPGGKQATTKWTESHQP
jgi:hypothetical protein